jgi:CO dehydrogenase maturation factor
MKIAILGKGGSGKSSVSWLLSRYLSQNQEYQTLAIDGDHNMDLTSCLGVSTDKILYFKDFNDRFRQIASLPQIGMWREYLKLEPVNFQYPVTIESTTNQELEKYINKVDSKLDLMVLGLGDEDIMLGDKCSHGLSAPLKYMLPTLQLENNSWLVLDSVAGSDMLNYGLYFAFDGLFAVVEGHLNSIKVAKQLMHLTSKQGLKLHFILNKYDSNNLLIQEFEREFTDSIIGKIPSDMAVMYYDYTKINENTKNSLKNIIEKIKNLPKNKDGYQKLKEFELSKLQ